MSQAVYIDGVGMTSFGRSPLDLTSLMVEAGRNALASSRSPEPQAIFVGAMNPEELAGSANIAALTAAALGFTGIPATRVETASSSGAAVLVTAYNAIASGLYSRVLAIAGEKMTALPLSRVTTILAETLEAREREAGATFPALAALIARAYMRRFKVPWPRLEEALGHVAIKNHLNGSRNPLAQFQKPITFEQYINSKPVAEPLRLFDCAPVSDGAAAVVLTREVTDIRVAGVGQGTDTLGLRHRASLTAFMATRAAAKQAYDMAGVGPRDIDFAEVHDAFTIFEVISMEDLGFFPQGEGWKAVSEGRTALHGEFPINPSGGLKSRGHPVGASGLAQVVEAVWQMRRMVESPRQVKKAHRALTHSIGGPGTNNFVIILERARKGDPSPPSSQGSYNLPIVLARETKEPERATGAEGILESYTVLHVPPQGFPAPLPLGLVLLEEGQRVLAQGLEPGRYKLGERVRLQKVDGVYRFSKMNLPSRLRSYLTQRARRVESLLRRK